MIRDITGGGGTEATQPTSTPTSTPQQEPVGRTIQEVEAEQARKRENRHADWVHKWRIEYRKIVDEARDAAETSQTPYWQKVYGEQVAAHTESINRISHRLLAHANSLKLAGRSNEDLEKGVKDLMKELQEVRIEFMGWWNVSVKSVSDIALRAERLLESMKFSADSESRNANLMLNELPEYVDRLVDGWPTVNWNEQTGMLVVSGRMPE